MIKVKWQHSYRQQNGNSNGNGNGNGTTPNSSSARQSPGSLTLSPVIDGVNSVSLARRPVGTIWEMDTIAEDSLPATPTANWSHDHFELNDTGEVVHKDSGHRITRDDVRQHGEAVLPSLITHVHARMLHELAFVEQAIPPLEFDRTSVDSAFNPNVSMHSSMASVRSSSSSICSTADGFRTMVDSDVPRCIFHTTSNYSVCDKLVVFVCSARGLRCGIWSRSLLLSDGVRVGSMLPYFEAAIRAGYGVLVMNPNMNTQVMQVDTFDTEVANTSKLPIQGSATPEEHVEHVWRKYVFPAAAHRIHFVAFGSGGALVTDLINRYAFELRSRLGNVAFIESAHRESASWSSGFRRWFRQHSVAWVRSSAPLNTDLTALDRTSHSTGSTGTSSSSDTDANTSINTQQLLALGCLCLSAGPCEGPSASPAFTARDVLDEVFAFLAAPSAYEYERLAAKTVRRNALKCELEMQATERQIAAAKHSPSRRFDTKAAALVPKSPTFDAVTIDDFQLLRVVGKGAFGKVMLVRRKKPSPSPRSRTPSNTSLSNASTTYEATVSGGKVFAMKVIKKAAVFARNQVEHTKTERRILASIDHPFLVTLRYAFQTASKLYFVMDFYNGGTLHFHLRRAISFDERRAQFYAAQLLLALAHLHTYNVVYRDLKPENVLMDDCGFIAITDFGLSRDNVDGTGAGLSTFCGTPEYIAPELIRRIPYGRAVDYWSFGVLVFEMLAGYTPFYHANRKRNFENILKLPLRLPTEFSDDAKSLLRGLLCKDPAKRLGSGPVGAAEIMEHAFFDGVDWEKLYKRDVDVPFRPIVRRDGEVNNVPEFFKRQDAVDSVVSESVPLGKSQVFQDFSYVDPYQL